MNRFLSLLTIAFLLSYNLIFAQEKGDQDDDDEPLPPKRSSEAKLGGAGGFTPGWLFLDTDEINKYLTGSFSQELETDGVALWGGQGYGYILLVKNLRVGGVGMSGTSKSRALDPNTNTRRNVDFTVGYGGVTVDYVYPIMPRLDLTAGILLGGGGVDIKMTRNSNDNKIWSDLWNEYGSNNDVSDYSRKLSGSFFIFQPSVNVEYAVTRWIGVRVGVSYLGMAGGKWKLDDEYDIAGVPDKINGRGFMINTGIFVGTFLF